MRKPKSKGESEGWVKTQVKQILKDTGWQFWMPSANAFGRSGVSDFLAVKQPALFMAIETKYKGVPTQLQLNFLKMIHDAGHYAFVVDETNVEVLRGLLMNEVSTVVETEYQSLMKWQENLTS